MRTMTELDSFENRICPAAGNAEGNGTEACMRACIACVGVNEAPPSPPMPFPNTAGAGDQPDARATCRPTNEPSSLAKTASPKAPNIRPQAQPVQPSEQAQVPLTPQTPDHTHRMSLEQQVHLDQTTLHKTTDLRVPATEQAMPSRRTRRRQTETKKSETETMVRHRDCCTSSIRHQGIHARTGAPSGRSHMCRSPPASTTLHRCSTARRR